jgi:hypothetical protein
MRLGCDLDGVLADLHGAFVATALELYPELDRTVIEAPEVGASPPDGHRRATDEPVAPGPPLEADLVVSPRQSDEIWQRLSSMVDFWETLEEIEEGAIRRLAAIAEERRWEVIFLTSRPQATGRTVQRQSQRWLERKGFAMPSVFVVHGSRGRIAEALDLDVVIDDRPDNCLDIVLESKAGAVLLWRGTQASVPASARRLGIAVAPSVANCFETLIEADRQGHDGALVSRLRRLFGLRTASSALLRR